MKKTLLTVLLLVFFASQSFSQNVLNPGFETWTAGNPDNWITANFTGGIAVTQSVDAHSGSFAAQGSVISSNSTTLPPILYSSGVNGFPMTQPFPTLEFWYKLISDSGDVMAATAVVYDGSATLIGAGGVNFTSTGTYVHAAMQIAYSGSNAASCVVYFTISNPTTSNVHVGSYFLVDDVAMTNNPVGVQEHTSNIHFLSALFPNPASGSVTLNYSLTKASVVIVSIVDVTGKKVTTSSFSGGAGLQHQLIDLSTIDAGIYICKIQTDEGTETKLIEVAR